MKISIFAGGLYTTLTARILPLAKMLNSLGVNCDIVTPIDWGSIAKGKPRNILSTILTYSIESCIRKAADFPDVVIIGRTSNLQAYLLEKILRHRKCKVIFDLDDALFLPVGRLLNINMRPGSFWLEPIVKDADFITVCSHYLLDYVRQFNQNATIVHVPIDVDLFNPVYKRHYGKLTIGWQGNPVAHYENLKILVKPLERIAQEYDIRFKIASYFGLLWVKQMFKKIEMVDGKIFSFNGINFIGIGWNTKFFGIDAKANFDIIISHVPPYKIKDKTFLGMHIGSKWLRKIVEEKKPKFVLCGHVHEDYGYEKFNDTIVVNCSIGKKGEYTIIDTDRNEIRMVGYD